MTFTDVVTLFSVGTQYNFTAAGDMELSTTYGRPEPGGRRHPGVHGHGLLAGQLGQQRPVRRALPLPAGQSEDRLDQPGLRARERRDGGDSHRREPWLRDQHLVRERGGGGRFERGGASRLRDDRHGHRHRAGRRVGAVPVTLHTVESDATGAAAATARSPTPGRLPWHCTSRAAAPGRSRASPAGISCGKTCSHAYPFGTVVTLKEKASRGLDLRPLVGRVQRQVHVQGHGQGGARGHGEVRVKNASSRTSRARASPPRSGRCERASARPGRSSTPPRARCRGAT